VAANCQTNRTPKKTAALKNPRFSAESPSHHAYILASGHFLVRAERVIQHNIRIG
jgi:hypothetical protein